MAPEPIQTPGEYRLLEAANAGIWLFDRDGRTSLVNARLLQLLGRTREQLLGQPIGAFLHPAFERDSLARLGPLLAGERGSIEVCLAGHEGEELWVLCDVAPVEDSHGELSGVLAVVHDITGHKRAESAKQATDSLFAAAVRASRDAIIVFRAEDERILDVNESWCRTTGWTREEVLGKSQRELGIWHEDEASLELARLMVQQGSVQDFEFSFRRRNGELGHAVLWTETVYLDGVPHVLAIGRDLTEARKEAEHRRQAQRLEELGRLAGGVAHDFNNLLAVIFTYGHLVLEALGPGHPRRADLLEIQRAAERAAALTRRLLTFSRKHLVELEPLELNAVVKDALPILRPLLGDDVELVARLAPGLPRIFADVSQVEQVLMNLAVNARDAMPEGGVLTLETAPGPLDTEGLEHGESAPRTYVLLSVTDTGTGMPATVKERLFEPFFTTKEPGKGTGLGLAIVQGVVRESGGHIQVDSEPGRGTRFEVFWPEAPADALAARPAQPGPAAQVRLEGTPVVLVIEDEASVRAGARRILEQAGCQVLEAGNGQEALALVARTERLDLVLSDVVMPRLGGKSFAARLAQLRPRVPVLFMSGYTADPDLLDGLPNAYPHLVPKPFTPQVLQPLVLEALGRVPVGTEDPEGNGGVKELDSDEGVKELGSTPPP